MLVREVGMAENGLTAPTDASSVASEDPSSVLLGSKLHPPGLRSGIVPRLRLAEAVVTCGAPVVLVVAAPGFGKTILLAQWEELDSRPFAWVSLDRQDNDPLLFWNYVVAAIRRIEPGFASALEPALSSAGGMVLDAIVPQILNELESTGREIVLVLDDYHWVTSPACHESIALLVERGPPNAQLVVSSRSDPPLPFARLRASGGLFELRAADLGFTEAETAEMFGGASGLDLAPDSIATLHRRTEGWPAGLYLALLSVRDVSDPTAALVEFGGSSRHVVDYLTEVVLQSETEEHRSFLLQTSILERMCASLCNSVTGGGDSARILAEIERANLFLVPLDEHREWFRYHHMFAELLRDERRRDRDTEPELHRRACQWFASAGHVDEAIQHAIAGGHVDTAATLIATHWLAYVNAGRLATLTGWLEAFQRDVVRADARLGIVEAWTLALVGDAEEARQALAAAREVGYQKELPDGSGTVEESVTLARASFPWSDVGAMLAAARAAYETESRRKSVWEPLAAFNLGWAFVLAGETDQAVPRLEQAAALAPRHEQPIVAADARCLLAKIALAAGDLARAERWIGEALELARTHGFADLPHVGFYDVILGALNGRRGELELADHLLGLGLAQMQGHWDSLLLSEALLERALVRRAVGARTEARAMVAEARATIESCPDPGILSQRVEEVARKLTPAHARANTDSELTERELEVLELLAKGLTKREVAAMLFVSYSTIHSHTKSIYRKLDGASRDEVLERARGLGLIASG
jgi:LuxR family transcriptional regulator, maltose regulon positive regulatory protein